MIHLLDFFLTLIIQNHQTHRTFKLVFYSAKGYKLQLKFGFPFGKLASEFGYHQQFLGFLSENQSLMLPIYLTIPGFLVGNPALKFGFPSPFLGVLEIRKPSNFEPCWQVQQSFTVYWTYVHQNFRSKLTRI